MKFTKQHAMDLKRLINQAEQNEQPTVTFMRYVLNLTVANKLYNYIKARQSEA